MFLNENATDIKNSDDFIKNAINITKYDVYYKLRQYTDRSVLYRNVAVSFLQLSTKKRYSSFLKKVFVFQKIYFTVTSIEKVENF